MKSSIPAAIVQMLLVVVVAVGVSNCCHAFVIPQTHAHHYRIVSSLVLKAEDAESSGSVATTAAGTPKTEQLGLLTFDLDDTLYPIDPIVQDANGKEIIDVGVVAFFFYICP